MKVLREFINPAMPTLTNQAPHVRDAINLGRVMNLWLLAVLPCVLVGIWNTGYQANMMMARLDLVSVPGFRGELLELLGIGHDPENFWNNLWHGFAYFLPIVLVSLFVAAFWERLFAGVRRKDSTEGVLLFSILFTLTLPPNIPLWQVAIGVSFAVVIAKEVFGGTGMNIVHPVLAGRAFLYFAYPDQITGDTIWTVVDNVSGATPLAAAKTGGLEAILQANMSWNGAFLGLIPGSMGETSTLACVLGGIILLSVRLLAWRIVVGGMIGLVMTSYLFNLIGGDSNPMFAVPWQWHLVLGGFAFGMIFLATDPVTSAHTDTGRWLYGILIGVLVILIRVTNPTQPEGMMFAILLASVFAPIIDYAVIQVHVRRRQIRFYTGHNKMERRV